MDIELQRDKKLRKFLQTLSARPVPVKTLAQKADISIEEIPTYIQKAIGFGVHFSEKIRRNNHLHAVRVNKFSIEIINSLLGEPSCFDVTPEDHAYLRRHGIEPTQTDPPYFWPEDVDTNRRKLVQQGCSAHEAIEMTGGYLSENEDWAVRILNKQKGCADKNCITCKRKYGYRHNTI